MSNVQYYAGLDPQIVLDWSDDNGKTWGNQHSRSMGKLGEYGTRCIWRRLGQSRERIYRISISDPVKRVVMDAFLEAESGIN